MNDEQKRSFEKAATHCARQNLVESSASSPRTRTAGRVSPQIPAAPILRSLVVARLLRQESFLAVEALVRSPARRSMGVAVSFGDDALGYFTERLDVDRLRSAVVGIVRQAKRNKAFEESR